LRYVLPPLAADQLGNGTYNENTTAIKNYGYVYKYNSRKLVKWKQLPGCEAIYYIYDKADHLVFSQDGEQRTTGGKWMFTRYDALGLPVVTGICANSIDYNNNPIANNVVTASTSTNTQLKGYTVSGINLSSPVVLTANYYDGYDFRNNITGISFDASMGADFNKQYTASYKGFLTGTLTAQLLPDGTLSSTYLYSVMYYDYKGQVIQTFSNNHLNGTEREYVACSFSGQPEKKKHVHSAPNKPTQTEDYRYAYDHAERLVNTYYKLNGDPECTMSANSYDGLGRLKEPTPYGLSNFRTTYSYNIRSWTSNIQSSPFSENLAYSYNGNVSQMQWEQNGQTRTYGFTYDNLSRLLAGSYSGASGEQFSASYTYDKHGNINTVTRYGQTTASGYGVVDNLTFNYNSTNQILNISDAGPNVTLSTSYDFKDWYKQGTAVQEYWYNRNGAMTKDMNRGISEIAYNTLGLPQKVDVKSPVAEARNEYTYSAGGEKLKVLSRWNTGYSTSPVIGSAISTSNLNVQKQTDYVGNMIYEDGVLKRILTENGYYENNNYYFYIKNHLGSNTVAADRNGNIIQRKQYYPFGMTMSISTNQGGQPYKFTGKELDMEHGLNLYDFEARTYDPATARFTGIDPLAEKYYNISPYVYCANNPINAYDLHGDSIWYTQNNNVITMHVTGKVINKSSDNINVGRAAKDIASGINDAYSGEFKMNGTTYTLQTDVQLEVAGSMDDVAESDHLFVLSDADGDENSARGATSMDGGKVITIAASDYANDNWFSNNLSWNNTRSAEHEFGHAAGLSHESASGKRNLMTQRKGGTNVTSEQRVIMQRRQNTINRGPNSHFGQPYPYVHAINEKTGQWETDRAYRLMNKGRR
jgi:RHS repeat-associated protein